MKLQAAAVGSANPELSDARQRVRAVLFGGTPREKRIGRFVLLSRLGGGGMGVVYVARDPELDRKVAVKLLHSDRSHSEAARARLLREAQAMARLSHPNVVTVYESGTHEGRVFIAMELIDGVDLREHCRTPRPWQELVSIYLGAARGLAAAHAVGLVHRDFKPENVMIGADSRARVLDFGLARAGQEAPASASMSAAASAVTLRDPDTDAPATADTWMASEADEHDVGSEGDLLADKMTRTGALLGTPAYMAPEQFVTGRSSQRSDQFSFCVALFEALYGQRPFVGETVPDLITAAARGEVVATPGRDVPTAVRAVILRGLLPDPRDRHPSMAALAASLERAVEGRRGLRRGLAVAALTSAAVVVGYLGASAPLEDPCAGGEAAMAAVWNPERAAALADAFAGSGTPQADVIWSHAAAQIDVYADAWVAGHEGACEAARITGEGAARLAERRAACLDDARRELDETLKVLADVDQTVVFHAVQAVAGLPELRRCADNDALLEAVAPPTDPGVAAAVEGARSRAMEVRALQRAGLYERALAEASALSRDVAGVDYPPVHAELDLVQGRIEISVAHYEDARATLSRAFWTATDCGHDAVAADAAVNLSALIGAQRAEFADGFGWSRQAEALIRRNHLGPHVTIAMMRGKAKILRVAGKPGEARVVLEEALTRLEATPDASDLDRAALLRDLGGVVLDDGHPDQAIALLLRSIDRASAALGEAHPDVGRAQHLLASAYYSAGRYDEALATFERSLAIKEAAFGGEHPSVADTLNNIGATLDELSRYEPALEVYRRSLAIREAALGERHPDVAASIDNIAYTLLKLGRLDEAEASMQRALAIFREAYGPRHPAVGVSLLGVAGLKTKRGAYAEAVALAEEATSIAREALGEAHPDVGYALTELAMIHLEADDPDAAIAPAREALAIRSAEGQNPLLRAEAALRLGQALWLAGAERDQALAQLKDARDGYAEHGPPEQLAGVDTWLKEQAIVLPE
ncbi:MAG: tetratricopeptide repeat protein [Myxococcales bacterium]|nr:tetratricopeptide repeat protein [Myxococcales bacterium]